MSAVRNKTSGSVVSDELLDFLTGLNLILRSCLLMLAGSYAIPTVILSTGTSPAHYVAALLLTSAAIVKVLRTHYELLMDRFPRKSLR